MVEFVTQSVIVILVGIYAIRATYSLLGHENFQPLSLLAAAVFLLVTLFFHRLKMASGLWLYAALVLSAIGLLVNAVLLFSAGREQRDLTHDVFSAICIAGWAIVGVSCAMRAMGRVKEA
jgi:hypothetical protein